MREAVVQRLQSVLDLVLVETEAPLPPPKAAKEALKKLALERVQDWVKCFGEGYKKLALGYNYLKQVIFLFLGRAVSRISRKMYV